MSKFDFKHKMLTLFHPLLWQIQFSEFDRALVWGILHAKSHVRLRFRIAENIFPLLWIVQRYTQYAQLTYTEKEIDIHTPREMYKMKLQQHKATKKTVAKFIWLSGLSTFSKYLRRFLFFMYDIFLCSKFFIRKYRTRKIELLNIWAKAWIVPFGFDCL